jgi:hypothetical protein
LKNLGTKLEIPSEGTETHLGYLYNPPGLSKQILSLVASFFGAILLGWIVSSIPTNLSDFSKGIIYTPFVLVFFLGYSAWISWLNVIVLNTIRWPMIKMLIGFFVYRKKPESINSIIPTNEKSIEIMVRAQKATKIFFILSWPIGIAGGIASMFIKTSVSPLVLFILVSGSSIVFGYALYYFGRRGYLPFPGE